MASTAHPTTTYYTSTRTTRFSTGGSRSTLLWSSTSAKSTSTPTPCTCPVTDTTCTQIPFFLGWILFGVTFLILVILLLVYFLRIRSHRQCGKCVDLVRTSRSKARKGNVLPDPRYVSETIGRSDPARDAEVTSYYNSVETREADTELQVYANEETGDAYYVNDPTNKRDYVNVPKDRRHLEERTEDGIDYEKVTTPEQAKKKPSIAGHSSITDIIQSFEINDQNGGNSRTNRKDPLTPSLSMYRNIQRSTEDLYNT